MGTSFLVWDLGFREELCSGIFQIKEQGSWSLFSFDLPLHLSHPSSQETYSTNLIKHITSAAGRWLMFQFSCTVVSVGLGRGWILLVWCRVFFFFFFGEHYSEILKSGWSHDCTFFVQLKSACIQWVYISLKLVAARINILISNSSFSSSFPIRQTDLNAAALLFQNHQKQSLYDLCLASTSQRSQRFKCNDWNAEINTVFS